MTCIIADCIFIASGNPDCVIRIDKDAKAYLSDCQIYSATSSYSFFKKLQTLWVLAKFLFKKRPR